MRYAVACYPADPAVPHVISNLLLTVDSYDNSVTLIIKSFIDNLLFISFSIINNRIKNRNLSEIT